MKRVILLALGIMVCAVVPVRAEETVVKQNPVPTTNASTDASENEEADVIEDMTQATPDSERMVTTPVMPDATPSASEPSTAQTPVSPVTPASGAGGWPATTQRPKPSSTAPMHGGTTAGDSTAAPSAESR